MLRRLSCCVVLQLALVAQAPTLAKLGPLPLDLPVVDLPLAAAQPLPAGGAIVLRVGKDMPWGQVQAALDRFAAGGGTLVHFAAVLPDGSPGALTVALPESADAPTVLNLRAHAGRPGTAPEAGIPLLQRAVEGWRARSKEPFVLGIEIPADATQEQALRLLAAAVEGGAERVVLRVGLATKVTKARLGAGRVGVGARSREAGEAVSLRSASSGGGVAAGGAERWPDRVCAEEAVAGRDDGGGDDEGGADGTAVRAGAQAAEAPGDVPRGAGASVGSAAEGGAEAAGGGRRSRRLSARNC